MKFNFSHVQPIDSNILPGTKCSVIYFRGCNVKCPRCIEHTARNNITMVNIDTIMDGIIKNKKKISHVILSGGEATLQPDAVKDISNIAHMNGLLVGIETSGIMPHVIEDLILSNCLDVVILDIKTRLECSKYLAAMGMTKEFSGYSDFAHRVLRTLSMCSQDPRIDLIITTTLFPDCPRIEDLTHILIDIHNNVKEPVIWQLKSGVPLDQDAPEFVPLKQSEIDNMTAFLNNYLIDQRVAVV